MICNELINYLYLIPCFESASGGLTPGVLPITLTFSPEILFSLLIWTINADSKIIRFWPIPDYARKIEILCVHQVDFFIGHTKGCLVFGCQLFAVS